MSNTLLGWPIRVCSAERARRNGYFSRSCNLFALFAETVVPLPANLAPYTATNYSSLVNQSPCIGQQHAARHARGHAVHHTGTTAPRMQGSRARTIPDQGQPNHRQSLGTPVHRIISRLIQTPFNLGYSSLLSNYIDDYITE